MLDRSRTTEPTADAPAQQWASFPSIIGRLAGSAQDNSCRPARNHTASVAIYGNALLSEAQVAVKFLGILTMLGFTLFAAPAPGARPTEYVPGGMSLACVQAWVTRSLVARTGVISRVAILIKGTKIQMKFSNETAIRVFKSAKVSAQNISYYDDQTETTFSIDRESLQLKSEVIFATAPQYLSLINIWNCNSTAPTVR